MVSVVAVYLKKKSTKSGLFFTRVLGGVLVMKRLTMSNRLRWIPMELKRCLKFMGAFLS